MQWQYIALCTSVKFHTDIFLTNFNIYFPVTSILISFYKIYENICVTVLFLMLMHLLASTFSHKVLFHFTIHADLTKRQIRINRFPVFLVSCIELVSLIRQITLWTAVFFKLRQNLSIFLSSPSLSPPSFKRIENFNRIRPDDMKYSSTFNILGRIANSCRRDIYLKLLFKFPGIVFQVQQQFFWRMQVFCHFYGNQLISKLININ